MKKIIVITGASDGIGKAAARELHAQGHEVVLIGRSPDKTKAIAEELNARYYIADFSDLEQVRAVAKQLALDYTRIDVLALNAGGIIQQKTLTKDGFEMTFQINHLAHFLLTGMLIKTLKKSHATVIVTSSAANFMNNLDLDDLNVKKPYHKWAVYGNAKLMNILFVQELHHRLGGKGISAAAFHPGVVSTGFSRNASQPLKFIYESRFSRMLGLLTPAQGADTLVWLATHEPHKDWEPGEYYVKRTVKRASPKAYQPELANELWVRSEAFLKDTFEW